MNEMKTLSFFGENGLTSTSANHIANLAKELLKDGETRLASLRFLDKTVSFIGDEKETTLMEGCDTATLANVGKVIDLISDLHSLIAFLREAIKEKERLQQEALSYTDNEARETLRAKRMELRKQEPCRADDLTELDVRASWSIGEQQKYLALEARAAVIGKCIHPSGSLSKAREELMKRMSNPRDTELNGKDTLIFHYIPSVSLEDVDKVFLSLQDEHRKVQAEFNGMKKTIEDAILASRVQLDSEYAEAKAKWDEEMLSLQNQESLITQQETAERTRRAQQVKELRIVIPHRLQTAYDLVNSRS